MESKEVKEKFLLELKKSLRDRVRAYRWDNRIASESEAVRQLLEDRLDDLDGKKKRKK